MIIRYSRIHQVVAKDIQTSLFSVPKPGLRQNESDVWLGVLERWSCNEQEILIIQYSWIHQVVDGAGGDSLLIYLSIYLSIFP